MLREELWSLKYDKWYSIMFKKKGGKKGKGKKKKK